MLKKNIHSDKKLKKSEQKKHAFFLREKKTSKQASMQIFVRSFDHICSFCLDNPGDSIGVLKRAMENKLGITDWTLYRLMYGLYDILRMDESTLVHSVLAKEATLTLYTNLRGD